MKKNETEATSPKNAEKVKGQDTYVDTTKAESNGETNVQNDAGTPNTPTATKKKVKGGDVDPNLILNCFRGNDTSIAPAARVTEIKEEETNPTTNEDVGISTTENQPEAEAASKKQKPVKPKGKSNVQFYVDTFYKNVGFAAKSGKTAYLCKEHHERIQKLIRVVGKDEISLFSYLYNVVEHHFSQFHDEIEESYETNNSIF